MSFIRRLRRKSRLGVFVLATLALALWTLGVYFYQVNTLYVLETGVWFPPYSVHYVVDTVLEGVLERLIPIIGLAALSFTPLFRRAFRDKKQRGDLFKLLLVFGLLELAFAAQQVWLVQTEAQRSSFGLFLVLAAGLTGGWRLGLVIGVLNTFALGLADHLAHLRDSADYTISYLRDTLTFVNLIVPIWAGALTGYLGEQIGPRRFHPLLALGLAVGAEAALTLFTLLSTWTPPQMFARFLRNLLVTPLLAGYALLVRYQLRTLSSPLELTQAELAVAQAELRALRAQINPHFLLNALSVIHHLVRTQPERARELILDLSALFQHSLQAGQFVPLTQELAHVKAYLALEKARLGERLTIVWQLSADDALGALVPTLCLQPLVENAVQHGLAPKPEGGTLSVNVERLEDELRIQVDDDGCGFEVGDLLSGARRAGRPPLGVSNIDARLQLLYGPDYKLGLRSSPGVGTTAWLRLPLIYPDAETPIAKGPTKKSAEPSPKRSRAHPAG